MLQIPPYPHHSSALASRPPYLGCMRIYATILCLLLSLAEGGLIRETFEVRDSYMYVPQTPGLGREIDWEQIEARTIITI